MNIVSSPRVTLVGRTQYMNPDHLGWKANNLIPGGQALAELAGRICYLSFGDGQIDGHQTVKGRDGNAEYLENILRRAHGSVIEHASLSFLVEGISRTLSHEWVRHRAGWAYSQLSQRFVSEDDVAFVKPPAIEFGTEEFEAWKFACDDSLAAYAELRAALTARGASKKRINEAARSVLPGCTETKMVVTANARSWRQWLEMRGAEGADAEIRSLAVTMLIHLQAELPDMFRDFKVERHAEGFSYLTNVHRKV